jgi:hypothetical protein
MKEIEIWWTRMQTVSWEGFIQDKDTGRRTNQSEISR